MPDIYVMRLPEEDGSTELLVTPVGSTPADLGRMWEQLEAMRATGYEVCSTCSKAVAKDERGDVLDGSGRCDECRP